MTEMYKHPIHTGPVKQLQQLKASLDRKILQAAQEVTSAYDSAAANEKKMEQALQEQDGAALERSRMLISYNVLREETDSDRALYHVASDAQRTKAPRFAAYEILYEKLVDRRETAQP